MRLARPRRAQRSFVATVFLGPALLLVAANSGHGSTAAPSNALPALSAHVESAALASSSSSNQHGVSKSKTVERTFLNNGITKVVDRRKVHVTVSDTHDLRSLQQIQVKWSGAHVTHGTDLDQNSDLAQNEEYSFDLFECRGVDSTSVPKTDRISPETCWTQFADERYVADGAQPAWQSDLYASAADRRAVVGAPRLSKQPALCKTLEQRDITQRWIPFVGVTGRIYQGGSTGCAGLPPEASPANFSSLSLPSNETFGVTSPSGNGRAQFDVFTGEDHASLGCSPSVPCSLVAIPIEGLSCDPDGANLPASQLPTQAEADAAKANCETNGSFKAGELLNNIEASGAPAVDGSLWWSASNWRNRITFPLTFAEPDNICDIVSKQTPISIYGSELLTQAATQWAPHFCLNSKLFNPKMVQTPEPEARRLVSSGSISAAASSYGQTDSYPQPTVNAPIAVSGFGIAFDIDNSHHQPVGKLNLDPRLLAKLLTESYPAQGFVQSEYPLTNGVATLSKNPLTLPDDPEFEALNPGIPKRISDAASTLLIVNVQSDVIQALTSYINNDPAARAWLNGAPDPWGMRVNPNYKGIKLPIDLWPLLDSFEPLGEYKIGLNDCLAVDPLPYLPLVANPQASLYQIALDADFAIAQSQTTCVLPSPIPGDTKGAKVVANGRQPSGDRFMLSLVSLADAARFNLPLASLRTSSSVLPTAKFTSTAGQTFVAPTMASLAAAVSNLKPDTRTGTWPLNYKSLGGRNHAKAYPGTMVMYATVPTRGVPRNEAADYARYIQYVSGPGQVRGAKPGQLPGGYLPLTKSNGLGQLASYSSRAATAIAAQGGELPSLDASSPGSPPPGGLVSPPPIGPGGGVVSPGGSQQLPSVTSPSGTTTPPTTANSSEPPTSPTVTTEALGTTTRLGGGFGSEALPALLLVLVIGAGGAAGISIWFGRFRR
jgi:hypothetical protein